MLHGRLRNADVYYRSAKTAQAAAGEAGNATIMIVPQFLAGIDIERYHLPADALRWSLEGWEGGDAAMGRSRRARSMRWMRSSRVSPTAPVPEPEAGRGRRPFRRRPGGAALCHRAQRRGGADRRNIGIRYVVANPSSYAYFSAERPEPQIAAACPGYNDWKYGMEARPPYLAAPTPAELEQRYVARQVIYLLGTPTPIPTIRRSTRAAWRRPRAPTAMSAAIPTPPPWRRATAARPITGSGTCRVSAMTATRC